MARIVSGVHWPCWQPSMYGKTHNAMMSQAMMVIRLQSLTQERSGVESGCHLGMHGIGHQALTGPSARSSSCELRGKGGAKPMQLLQQRPGVPQVGGVKALDEPAIDRG